MAAKSCRQLINGSSHYRLSTCFNYRVSSSIWIVETHQMKLDETIQNYPRFLVRFTSSFGGAEPPAPGGGIGTCQGPTSLCLTEISCKDDEICWWLKFMDFSLPGLLTGEEIAGKSLVLQSKYGGQDWRRIGWWHVPRTWKIATKMHFELLNVSRFASRMANRKLKTSTKRWNMIQSRCISEESWTIPSGKLTVCYGSNHHVRWLNQL